MAAWVFFDLAGTLLDESLLVKRIHETVADVLIERGTRASVDDLPAVRGGNERLSVSDRLLVEAAQAVEAALAGVPESVQVQGKVEEVCREVLRRMKGAEVTMQGAFPDAREVLQAVGRLANLGVIADQKTTVRQVLRRDRLDPYLRVVVLSEEVGAAKPNRRMFEEALRQAECTAVDAIMVGDSMEYDIRPANEMGFRTVRIDNGPPTSWRELRTGEGPDEAVTSLRGVAEAVERLLGARRVASLRS